MNYTVPKAKSVTEDGIIVDTENSVLGYKCLQCSTAHIFDENTLGNITLMVDTVSMWKAMHADCGALYE